MKTKKPKPELVFNGIKCTEAQFDACCANPQKWQQILGIKTTKLN